VLSLSTAFALTARAEPISTSSADSSPRASSAESLPGADGGYLKGRVEASPGLLLQGSLQTIAPGTKVDLTLMGNLNSEVSQKGDEVFARVAIDVKDGQRVLLPGGWYIHGVVSDVASQRRLGRDGYVEVEFDNLVSADGSIELPFQAKLSTKDSELKAIAKTLAIDSGYLTKGALGGAILSAQLTGIPVAIATHGYSLAIGAGVGAGLGAFGALKRKGKIASLYPGDEMHVTISEPLTLPGFNPAALLSAASKPRLANLDLLVSRSHFSKDPLGDSQARILTIDLKVDNRTDKEFSFFDLAVVSDHNQRYYPSPLSDLTVWKKTVPAHSCQAGKVTFSVDSPKHKYWIVLLDRKNREELTRAAIN